MAQRKNCSHVKANGEVCEAIPLRDSQYCYWHHKARSRRRHHDRIGGPISEQANSGITFPLLEDGNAIQIAIQEIMQAILDRRIDSKRAGLLLYSIQIASSNLARLRTEPFDDAARIRNIGEEDEELYNDTIEPDERAERCNGECADCAERDCDSRDEGTSPTLTPHPATAAPTPQRPDQAPLRPVPTPQQPALTPQRPLPTPRPPSELPLAPTAASTPEPCHGERSEAESNHPLSSPQTTKKPPRPARTRPERKALRP